MPVNTADQQITIPVLVDAANQNTSFTDFVTDVESRLVKRYVNDADRTARNPTPATGELCFLAAPGRQEWFDGVRWRELLPIYALKTSDAQVVNNSVTLVNDSHLFIPCYANGLYVVESAVWYESSTTADIKVAVTGPAGATTNRNSFISGPTTLASTITTVDMDAQNALGAAATHSAGGNGVGVSLVALQHLSVVTLAATAGNITLQWAQNTLDATNTRVQTGSWMRATRVG